MFNMNSFILVKVLKENQSKHFLKYKKGTVLLSPETEMSTEHYGSIGQGLET